MTTFDNKDRSRRYGIRVGDIVTYCKGTDTHEIIDLGCGDNNAVYTMHEGEPRKLVAEWCKIVTKVEDREK